MVTGTMGSRSCHSTEVGCANWHTPLLSLLALLAPADLPAHMAAGVLRVVDVRVRVARTHVVEHAVQVARRPPEVRERHHVGRGDRAAHGAGGWARRLAAAAAKEDHDRAVHA